MSTNGIESQSSSVARPAIEAGKRVYIFDTTLRDGEQSPGASMTVNEKLEVADALVRLGVDIIEAGFPIASPGDLDAVRQIAERAKGVTVCGLARAVKVDVEAAVAALPSQLLHHRDSGPALNALRDMVSSAYLARFDPAAGLSQRVLLPAADEEHNGMEDARFVRFTADDGSVADRATYTAYDGRDIAPRLITTPDFLSFAIHRLSGPAARNKGMALFPRAIGGRHLALARTVGERISLASSADGFLWSGDTVLHTPTEAWEMVQTGNCGSPIETDRGWLVLTHGVGPFRVYSISAILLDLDDPSHVLARSTEPILRPTGVDRNGYVPNVVYSCGGIVHDGRLWVPIGIGDAQVGVFSTDLDTLLDSMQPSGSPDGPAG